jgi:hypothetical protein
VVGPNDQWRAKLKRKPEPDANEAAKAYVDTVLAERHRLGYSRKVAKKSYGQAVNRAAGVFEMLRRTTGSGGSDKT